MAHTTQQQLGGLLLNALRVEPVAIITRDDIVDRILSHLNLPTAATPTGPGGSLARDLGDERVDCVLGMDPEPSDADRPRQAGRRLQGLRPYLRFGLRPAAEAQSPTPPPPAPLLHALAHPPGAGSSQSGSVRGELAIGVWR